MEGESVLNLFDSCWFEHEILNNQADPSNSEPNPDQKTLEISNPSLPAILTRSMDELVSSSSGSSMSSFSPSSVLLTRRLQTIFSGKEVEDSLSEQEAEVVAEPSSTGEKMVETETPRSCAGEERRRSRGRTQEKKKKRLQRGMSKSLSDLEFEELKGFMELGFVFSEEDKGSEFLSSILPGLQRLGVEEENQKERQEEKEGFRRRSVDGCGISRPYLSEAWKASERNKMKRRENHPLTMSWGDLPSMGSEIDMKDYLKSWAHTVASSVR